MPSLARNLIRMFDSLWVLMRISYLFIKRTTFWENGTLSENLSKISHPQSFFDENYATLNEFSAKMGHPQSVFDKNKPPSISFLQK